MELGCIVKTHRFGRQTTAGFTLVELLAVVTIIAILIGLAALTMSSARQRAMAVKTNTLLVGLSTAINHYFTVFDAYPGPFGPDQTAGIEKENASGPPTCVRASALTGTQNMLLGLANTIYPAKNTESGVDGPFAEKELKHVVIGPAPGYHETSFTHYVDAGKPGSVRDYAAGKTHNAFYNFDAKTLSPPYFLREDPNTPIWPNGGARYEVIGASKNEWHNTRQPGAPFLAFPTIIDAFADPLPILYYRKTRGIEGEANENNAVVNGRIEKPGTIVKGTPVPRPHTQGNDPPTVASYYFMDNAAYTDDPHRTPKTGNSAYATVGSLGTNAFQQGQNFTESSNAGRRHMFNQNILAEKVSTISGNSATVRGGGYVLISAGIDRSYGNVGTGTSPAASDDIVIVGGQ